MIHRDLLATLLDDCHLDGDAKCTPLSVFGMRWEILVLILPRAPTDRTLRSDLASIFS